MKKTLQCAAVLLLLATLNAHLVTAFAQGTAFTYQGRLNSSGSPASGSFDLVFTLYNTNASGVAIAGPVTNATVVVSNGLFTTLVDFGNVFAGASNWLEIAVSTNGANAFMALTPRQQLTPTPYAIFAGGANAAGLTGTIAAANIANGTVTSNLLSNGAVGSSQLAAGIGVWSQSGSDIFYNIGNAGLGTSTPQAALQVNGAFIGGGLANTIAPGLTTSAIVSGNSNAIQPGATNSYLGGGFGNTIQTNSIHAVIGGGFGNTIGGNYATVGGGYQNFASGNVTGGGDSATVGGGYPRVNGKADSAAFFTAAITAAGLSSH